jgi:hypothetical protein
LYLGVFLEIDIKRPLLRLFFVRGSLIFFRRVQPLGPGLRTGLDSGEIGIFPLGPWTGIGLAFAPLQTTILFFLIPFGLCSLSGAFIS